MKEIILITAILFGALLSVFSQGIQCDSSFVLEAASKDLSVFIYPKSAKIRKSESINYGSVESLLSALISSTNLDEHNESFEFPISDSKKNFFYYKNLNPGEFYILPQFAFYFNFIETDYAYVKFYLHEKDKPLQKLIVLCYKANNRWKIKNEMPFFISTFFKSVKTNYLIGALKGIETDNDSLNKIISKYAANGKIDLNSIAQDINIRLSTDELLQEILESKN